MGEGLDPWHPHFFKKKKAKVGHTRNPSTEEEAEEEKEEAEGGSYSQPVQCNH